MSSCPCTQSCNCCTASCCMRGSVIVCTPAAPGCGISARLHCAWHCPACCGWRNGSSRKGLAALAEGGTRNVMARSTRPVHRNLHTRVSFLYLEFEDWLVVIGADIECHDVSCPSFS